MFRGSVPHTLVSSRHCVVVTTVVQGDLQFISDCCKGEPFFAPYLLQTEVLSCPELWLK